MGRNPTADTYMCTYTDHESAPPAAKLSLSQSQKKKTTKHRLSRTSGRGGRRQEQPSRTPGSPGARRGRRWPRPRSPPAHAAAPPGRAAAAAAGHPQRAAGKFPRRPDGTAGPLLPLVQSTTCFGLHLVTGSMAGPSPPAPAPATDRSSSGRGLAPSHAPIPAAPLRAAPSPARLLPPAAGPPRCRSAPRCRVPPGPGRPRAWKVPRKKFLGLPLRQVRRGGDPESPGILPGSGGRAVGRRAARPCAPLRRWLSVSHSLGVILAASAECLEPRLSPYWLLGFLFLNRPLKSVLGCGGCFTRRVCFSFAAFSWQLH